ncbi:MAG: flap endonuclease [Myxococcales bacterium]|nr:flap endonuclease [Myxococcales bacterium]
MKIYLVDGTYELFRAYYGAPSRTGPTGKEVGACRALFGSLLSLLTKDQATHVAVAFDTVIESFRNKLFPGYKTGAGIEPDLYQQFPLAEQITQALGFVCWPMTDFEADDALATAAFQLGSHPDVDQVIICSPDKDLMQCVDGQRVICWDRRRGIHYDEPEVINKMGVAPASIPDYLALVGDTADGIPGISKWGAKSTAQVLNVYPHIENIPSDPEQWTLHLRGRTGLVNNLNQHHSEALLFKKLATLRLDVPINASPEALKWNGARNEILEMVSLELRDPKLSSRIPSVRKPT